MTAASSALGELSASTDHATDGLDQVILHLGHPTFADALLAHVRRIADVDHCMVFAFKSDRDAHCLLTAGNIATGNVLGDAYAEHFHAHDPNKETIFNRARNVDVVMMPFVARGRYRRDYRKLFFDDSGIVDKFAAARWHQGVCLYTNFYRVTASGRYTDRQIAALHRAGPALAATITRHCQLSQTMSPKPRDASGLLREAFMSPPLNTLTRRERDVCIAIMLGLSSECIARELAISLNSVLTYRRRAYQRLYVTSQNELFAMVMSQFTEQRGSMPLEPATQI